MKIYECYFDGACEPQNPGGEIGAGIYVTDGEKEYATYNHLPAKEENTNNMAEYLAFIMILDLMSNKEKCEIKIYGDSMLVVNQMDGKWQIKNGAYTSFAVQAKNKLEKLKLNNVVSIEWIPREKNVKADYQSMKAIGFKRRKY